MAWTYRPAALIGNLLLCFSLWLIIGAIGFSNWPSPPDKDITFGEVFLLTIIPGVYITILLIVNTQYSFHPSPQISSRAIFIVAAMCFCLTSAVCILLPGSRNLFQDYFVVIGGTFAGGVGEIYTGVVTRYMESLERANGSLI